VIIPTLNEGSTIGETLRRIPRSQDVEVIVVDGGSRDRTVKIAGAAGARVIRTAMGRACQMNVGAAVARGEILLFLHADTHLPANFENLVHETLRGPGVIAGAFRLRIASPRRSVRFVEALANLRSRYLGMPYGDQALFLRKHYFRTAAGFAKLPIMEDFEFVRRLRRWGRISIAPAAAVTSARRWERLGLLRTTLINQLMILAYLLGVAPPRLARWYRGASAPNGSRPTEAPTPLRWLRSFRFLWHAGASHSYLLPGNRGN
jgi:rSAM/selenodomain-associated transferase 2